MDALRNYKKISLLAVAILFLFTFFNLILDAPLTWLCNRSHLNFLIYEENFGLFFY